MRSSSVVKIYQNSVKLAEHKIDSIKQIPFINIYANEDVNKILSIPVQCKYSYIFPQGNPEQERTDIFYFTPQRNKIISQKQIKTM